MEWVECYSGYAYPERPTAMGWRGERLVIEQVEQQWRSTTGWHFRVRTTTGSVFELQYSAPDDHWQIDLIE